MMVNKPGSSCNKQSTQPLLLNTEPAADVLSDNESGACFLCLEGDGENPRDKLLPCCTRCNAMTHARCWQEYRYNQRIASLRCRMLRVSLPRSQMLCTICKTGNAKISREEDAVLKSWMWCGESRIDSEEEFNGESQDLVDVAAAMCSFRVVVTNLVLLLVCATVTAVVFAKSESAYAGDWVMVSFVVVCNTNFPYITNFANLDDEATCHAEEDSRKILSCRNRTCATCAGNVLWISRVRVGSGADSVLVSVNQKTAAAPGGPAGDGTGGGGVKARNK
ncbi:unnamed protein product [Amoebophrya sp. A120]|nr:unnamed protein product [Amoebophrya sp. A120]|eukprot:GSA120T00014522001.1